MSNNRLWEDMLSTKGPTKKDWYEEEDREEGKARWLLSMKSQADTF